MHNTMKILGYLMILLFSPKPSLADYLPVKNLKLAYDVFIGDMLAGSVEIDINAGLKWYIVESRARSHGWFEFLTKYRVKNKVVGRLTTDGLRPEYYKTWGSWVGKRRTVEISYESLGHLSYKTVPTAAEDDRDLVPPRFILGTTDPMTAIFSTFYGNWEATSCDDVLNVFDGRRRYNIHFSEIARRETKGPLYTGSARVCRARQIILAGASRRIWLPQFSRPKWTDFWIASVRPGLPQLPVRINAKLGVTDLVIHLVEIGGRKYPPGETFVTGLPNKVNWFEDTELRR